MDDVTDPQTKPPKPPPSESNVCGGCMWWKRRDVIGQCRAKAPIPEQGTMAVTMRDGKPETAHWPVTLESDWCGEFKQA